MSVARELNSNGWLVHYKRLVNGRFDIPEATIHARHVILGAGALGSTKILFRSKERGLNISPTIGTKFSTNGDMLAFSYDGAKKTNSTPRKDVAPGPCITTVMDMRSRNGKVEDSFVIEDGTAPSSVAQVYSIGLTLAGKVKLNFLDNEDLNKFLTLPEIWDKMAEIMQIIIHYGDQIRL